MAELPLMDNFQLKCSFFMLYRRQNMLTYKLTTNIINTKSTRVRTLKNVITLY